MAIEEIISFSPPPLFAAPAQKGDVTLQHAHQTDAPIVRDVIALASRPQWWMKGDLGKLPSEIVQTEIFHYLSFEEHVSIANARCVPIFCTLELLPGHQRVEHLVAFFGNRKKLLRQALFESKENRNDTVESFIQKAMSSLEEKDRATLVDDIQSAGLDEPCRFLLSAVLAALSNLKDYPIDLAEECISHLNDRTCITEFNFTGFEADSAYQLQQALKKHVFFNEEDNSFRINVCTSLIRQIPDLSDEVKLEAFELIVNRPSLHAHQILSALARTLSCLPGDVQNVMYTSLRHLVFQPGMPIEDFQSIFTSLIETLPSLDREIQSSAISDIPNIPGFLHAKILKSLIKLLPTLQGDILRVACTVLFDVASGPAMERNDRLAILDAFVQDLPKLSLSGQKQALNLIQGKHLLHRPHTLHVLVNLLPSLEKISPTNDENTKTLANIVFKYISQALAQPFPRLNKSPQSDGANLQLLVYTTLEYILKSDALKLFPMSTQTIIEMANTYKALCAHRCSSQIQKSVQDTFADQLIQSTEALNRPEPGSIETINERSILLSTASVWAAMATDVYPFLSEARKGKMKVDIDVVFIKWIAMLSTNRGYFENRKIFIELAPAASAALTHVYSNVVRPNSIHLTSEVIEQYKKWALQQDELGNVSQCFLDAWHNRTQHPQDGSKV